MNQYLEFFKFYLFSRKHSKATVKNYTADISRFITWYEATFPKIFKPEDITQVVIQKYKSNLEAKPATSSDVALSFRTKKRHFASLRKFFSTLAEQKLIKISPVDLNVKPANNSLSFNKIDIFENDIKSFKDYLYRNNCSRITIKNYLTDIRQFLTWLESVSGQIKIDSLYKSITTQSIETYKERLLKEREISPISVNRKLSAIRKFLVYLFSENLIGETVLLTLTGIGNTKDNSIDRELFNNLTANTNNPEIVESKPYSSRFAPFRLLNTLKLSVNLIIDSIFILPLLNLFQKIQLPLYELFGKSIFKSASKSLNNGALINNIPVDNLILKGVSSGRSVISLKKGLPKFLNISKRFYDPLNISLDGLPLYKKIYYTIRHKRPVWYKKYHENPVSHYLHFSILLVFIGILVYWINYNFFHKPGGTDPVFASLPLSPPRFLSFKGNLTDETGNPIITESNLRFSLYRDEVSSGSSLLWQEVLSVNPDENGNFYALLGRNNYIPDRIFTDNPDIYLGVARGQNTEMSPRQKIATISLAYDSESLHGLTPITSSGEYKNTLLALDSAGNLSISGDEGPKFQATEGNFTLSGEGLILETNTGSNGSIVLNPDSLGMIDLQKPLQNSTDNNNFPDALGSVEVNDTFAILATSSAIPALNIRQDSIGMLISASSSGTAKFTLDYLGNSMIQGSLTLNGGIISSNQTTFNFLPDNVINLSIGGSSTELNLGATTGNTIIRNNLVTNGNTTLGTDSQDNIFLKGRVSSHIIASESGKFDLGSTSNSFNNAYIANLFLSNSATTSGFLKRSLGSISLLNQTDSLLLGGSSIDSALIKLAGSSGQDTFFNAGKVGIGLTTPVSDTLQVYGDIRVGTTATDGCLKRYDGTAITGTCSSDERLKKDIIPIENVLDKLSSLTPVTFSMRDTEFPEYKFGKETSYGLIAQQVESIFPELVETDERGYKMVKYGPELTMLSLSGIKELNTKVNTLNTILTKQKINSDGDILIIKSGDEYKLKGSSGDLPGNTMNMFKAIIGNLRIGLLSANEAILDNLAITTENVSIAGLSLQEYILDIVEDSIIYNQSNVIIPRLAADNLKTDLISPLASDSEIGISLEKSQLSILNSQSSTGSAVAVFDNQGNASLSGNLQAKNINSDNASISGTLRAGKIIAENIEGLEEKLATLAANQNTSSTAGSITNIYNIYNNSSNSANINQHSTPTPAISPTILAENSPLASPSAEIDNLSTLLTDDYKPMTDFIPLASYSAALAYVPNMNTDFTTIHQGLMVLGYTSVVDLSVSDQISINGNFILSENSINVLGADLEIQPLRQGNIRLMGGLMTLDTKGDLAIFGNAYFAKDVKIKGKLSASLIAPVPGSDLIIQLSDNVIPNLIRDPQHDPEKMLKQVQHDNKFIVKNSSGSGVLSVNNLGDLVASGAATFKDIAVNSLNIVRGVSADTSAIDTVASSSAGIGTITHGYTTRTIYSPYVTADSLIYITLRSTPNPSDAQTNISVPYLSRQVPEDTAHNIKGSFTVQIPAISTQEILFNWWIIN